MFCPEDEGMLLQIAGKCQTTHCHCPRRHGEDMNGTDCELLQL